MQLLRDDAPAGPTDYVTNTKNIELHNLSLHPAGDAIARSYSPALTWRIRCSGPRAAASPESRPDTSFHLRPSWRYRVRSSSPRRRPPRWRLQSRGFLVLPELRTRFQP